MLLDRNQSALLVVDVQEKLTPLIANHSQLLAHCEWMIQVASDLNIPVVLSEQYPQGLGHTVPCLAHAATPALTLEKTHFSCVADPKGWQGLQRLAKTQWVLVGIEAHVCVLQTALALLALDQQVAVVVDAVGSRAESDKSLALSRLMHAGVQCVSREMVLFEWLCQAATPEFKTMSQQYLRRSS